MFGPPVSKTDSYDCRETTVTTEVVGIQIRESGSCKIPEAGKQVRKPTFCSVFGKEATFLNKLIACCLKTKSGTMNKGIDILYDFY